MIVLVELMIVLVELMIIPDYNKEIGNMNNKLKPLLKEMEVLSYELTKIISDLREHDIKGGDVLDKMHWLDRVITVSENLVRTTHILRRNKPWNFEV